MKKMLEFLQKKRRLSNVDERDVNTLNCRVVLLITQLLILMIESSIFFYILSN